MKTMMKPMLLSAAALAAALSIVFCGALFWIKSTVGLQWVQARINTAIPGVITIERHRLSLLDPSLDLYGVILHDPEGHLLAGFTHFSVRLDGWALWRRELRLKAILIDGPWADLALRETSGLNLMTALVPPAQKKEAEAPTPDGTGLPFNIVFESIQLTNGRVTFRPPDDTLHLQTTGITLSAAGDLMARSGRLDLALASVRFNSTGIHPEAASLILKASLDGDKLNLAAFDLTSGQTNLRLSGSADNLYSTPMVDAVLSINSQLAELKTIFNLAGDYAGPVKAKLTINGNVANPDAGLVLTVDGGRIAGQPLDHGELSIRLQDRQVAIDTAALRLADGAVILDGTVNLGEAFPRGFLAPPANANAIAYTLTLVQDIPEINPWLNRFVDITGRMTSRLSLSGRGVTPADISARLTLDGSGKDLLAPGMDQPANADLNLSAQMDRGRIAISRLDAATDGVVLSGDGRLQIDERTIAGNLSLTAADLSRALAVVGIPTANGTCNATLTVDGNLNQPQFSVDLSSKNLTFDTYDIGNIAIRADMDHDGVLTLRDLNLQNRDSRIHGNGRLRLQLGGGIDPGFVTALDLDLETVSVTDFMVASPIAGSLDGRLRLGGPPASLTGELALKATALSTDAATIGDVDTRMRLEAGTVLVDRIHLRNRNSTLNATGRLQLLTPGTLRPVENPQFDITVHSDHLDPGDFIDTVSGHFTVNGELAGRFTDPAGQIVLAGKQINLAGQPIESVSIDTRLDQQRLWLDHLLVAIAPDEQIRGKGWMDPDKTMNLHLQSDGIAISRIQRLNDLFPGDGLLQFALTARGHMENPDIDGHLTVTDLIVNDAAMRDINLTFSLHDMLAETAGNLNFDLDAACDLKKGDFDARLVFDHTQADSYFKAAGKPDFHGTVTGRVTATGNIRDVANASATVELDEFHLRFKETELIASNRMVAQLAEQKLSIPEFDVALFSSGRLRLKGEAQVNGPLNLVIDGRIPLAAGAVFSDELADAGGMIALKGRISGETAEPQIDARIDLEQIGMTVPGLVQKLHDLNGSIHLTPDNIRIDALNGFLDTGSFNVDGSMDYEKFRPTQVNVAIDMKSLPLEIPDTLTVLLNGDINITGSNRSVNAQGTIMLLEGVYYKDVKISLVQIAAGATTRRRSVAPETKTLSIPYFDTVKLDITVGHRQPFMVQNNMAELEISPDLKIGGSLAHPIVSGRAQVKEGTLTLQKKTFDVKKGIIDFVSPYKTEADIDIESETKIRTWTIRLTIKGTPDNLDIQLSSSPTETDSDILSLLLFGRTAGELSAGEGGIQSTTTQIMADMIADTFGDDIKRTTGIDILKVKTNGSDDQDAGAVKVTVGKHLSDRMTVKYAVETKDGEITQRAITEYKLLEHILVSGFQNSKGIYGSELMYRIEFR